MTPEAPSGPPPPSKGASLPHHPPDITIDRHPTTPDSFVIDNQVAYHLHWDRSKTFHRCSHPQQTDIVRQPGVLTCLHFRRPAYHHKQLGRLLAHHCCLQDQLSLTVSSVTKSRRSSISRPSDRSIVRTDRSNDQLPNVPRLLIIAAPWEAGNTFPGWA